LDKTKATVIIGKTLTLTATIKPDDATNKTIKWTSSNENIATVSGTGIVTGKADGTAIITAAATDGSGVETTCNVTVMDEITATWEEINEMAKEIANDSSITNSSTQAIVTIDGVSKTIKVGETYKVKYGTTETRVRVLGFKHDDLVNTAAYGGNHTKASISFEFLDFMTGSTYKQMNSSNTNSGGWANTQMRKDLNGYSNSNAAQSGAIGGLGANLNNKSYIKQVKKKYIGTYNNASSVTTCNDYLWLLAASEVVNAGHKGGNTRGYAITKEGEQYKYYQRVTDAWDSSSAGREKRPTSSGATPSWFLRSPHSISRTTFCRVNEKGGVNYTMFASHYTGVAPGFCI
ncbi:MAG: Ig domain-containing protein, partial [Clostridia bacterium]|nr:Ig domain-containing protein [Clostridia bacterium]